jgi:hypothetical protein
MVGTLRREQLPELLAIREAFARHYRRAGHRIISVGVANDAEGPYLRVFVDKAYPAAKLPNTFRGLRVATTSTGAARLATGAIQ